MGDAIGFIRKNGRIIPLHAASGVGRHGKLVGHAAHAYNISRRASSVKKHVNTYKKDDGKDNKVKINRALDMTGLGLSVASGVVAAATFSGGWKTLAAGALASHAIDAAGIAVNVASVAKGNAENKSGAAKQAAKQEARNFAIGNAIYGAGLVGIKKNRQELVGYAKSILKFARKAVNVASDVE